MNPSGLIFDESAHYLDHLGPFCSLAKWPLLLCEPTIADQALAYYPDLQIIETNPFEISPSHLVSCEPLKLIQSILPNWKNPTFWLPHGHSDKGLHTPFFEALQNETGAFVYGQKMVDTLTEKNISVTLHRVGNFRLLYWEKHKEFYQKIVEEKILSCLPKNKKNFLYAPTWDDVEKSNSFWHAFPKIAQALPDSHNLIVKLHPNTLRQFAAELQPIMGKYNRENILFLEEFPPIYPLLSICDGYIGDTSSIGYDFLYFDKPMFFLKHNPYLSQCGVAIEENYETIFQPLIDTLSPIRKQTYDHTFDTLREPQHGT